MKKLFVLFAILIFSSCYQRSKITVIETFDKEITSIIHPKEKGMYTTYRVEIQGKVNDSVMFKFSDNGFPFYFTGKVDYYILTDYYGGYPTKFIFEPYKASKGKLTVTQKLL